MKFNLTIPYNEKDAAKIVAKEHGCALWFNDGGWVLVGDAVPEPLLKYVRGTARLPAATKTTTKSSVKAPATQTNYTYVVDLPFMMREMASEIGAYFNPDHKVYLSKSEEKVKRVRQFMSQPYSYEAWIEKNINDGLVRKDLLDSFATETTITPRDYQQVAVNFIMDAYYDGLGGFLLADEVGLGKTISAALTAQADDFKTILVVTTLSAIPHWRKTFLKFKFNDKEIIIINYDRLQKLFTHDESRYKSTAKTKKAKNKRLAKNGEAPEFDLIVFDESHKLRNSTTMRTKLAMKLADQANFVLYMSATAGQNPLELSYLAPLLARITGDAVKNMVDFEKWCQKMDLGVKRGDFGKWIWDGTQESIDKIHSLLFKSEPCAALRRTPSDIAGYPEINRALTPLDLSPDELYSYNLAWNEFKHLMQGYSGKKINKGDSQNILVAKLRLRQKASLLKVPYTVLQTQDLLENGHQVAISVAFKETLAELQQQLEKDKIGVSVIHGDLNPREKEEQRMRFQRGENTVVIFTVEEAISLHQGEYNDAVRSMLIHDLRWSAISMSQIEGRTHRDGKFSQIYWLFFTDTIEEEIAQIVLNRVISMKGMIGDDTSMLKEIEALLSARVTAD